jgi:hypothetical protein
MVKTTAKAAPEAEFSLPSGSPPPPPNFEPVDEQWYSNTIPAGRKTAVGKTAVRANGNGRTVEVERPTTVKNPEKVVVVQVRTVGDWQKTCRELVAIAGQFEGRDSLRLVLVGHAKIMDFPNQNTHYCPELVSSMEKMPVTVRVDTV